LFAQDAARAGTTAVAERPRTSFFPANYQGELLIDFQAMRENGLLDRLERLPMMAELLEAVAKTAGGDFESFERARTAVVYDKAGGRTVRTVLVLEGNVVRPAEMPVSWKPARIGELDGWLSETPMATETLLLWPQPQQLVAGSQELLESILRGDLAAGRAHPELQQFLQGEGVLFQYGFGCFGRPPHVHLGSIGYPSGWIDANDPLTFFRLRLSQDAKSALTLSMTLRFQRATSGLLIVKRELREGLGELLASNDYAFLKPLLESVAFVDDDPDLTVSLPLGSPQQAVAKVERAVIALLRMAWEQRGR
jgi:hypothetical protein